jgi:hypothetical protein
MSMVPGHEDEAMLVRGSGDGFIGRPLTDFLRNVEDLVPCLSEDLGYRCRHALIDQKVHRLSAPRRLAGDHQSFMLDRRLHVGRRQTGEFLNYLLDAVASLMKLENRRSGNPGPGDDRGISNNVPILIDFSELRGLPAVHFSELFLYIPYELAPLEERAFTGRMG